MFVILSCSLCVYACVVCAISIVLFVVVKLFVVYCVFVLLGPNVSPSLLYKLKEVLKKTKKSTKTDICIIKLVFGWCTADLHGMYVHARACYCVYVRVSASV